MSNKSIFVTEYARMNVLQARLLFSYYHKTKLQIHDTYHFKKGIKISGGCAVRVLGHVCKKRQNFRSKRN